MVLTTEEIVWTSWDRAERYRVEADRLAREGNFNEVIRLLVEAEASAAQPS